MNVIQRYDDLLQKSLASSTAAEALEGGNLLTGVNRGLGDTAWGGDCAIVRDLGYRLSAQAILVAKELRQELGISF